MITPQPPLNPPREPSKSYLDAMAKLFMGKLMVDCLDCFGSGQALGKEHPLGEDCPSCAGKGYIEHE